MKFLLYFLTNYKIQKTLTFKCALPANTLIFGFAIWLFRALITKLWPTFWQNFRPNFWSTFWPNLWLTQLLTQLLTPLLTKLLTQPLTWLLTWLLICHPVWLLIRFLAPLFSWLLTKLLAQLPTWLCICDRWFATFDLTSDPAFGLTLAQPLTQTSI